MNWNQVSAECLSPILLLCQISRSNFPTSDKEFQIACGLKCVIEVLYCKPFITISWLEQRDSFQEVSKYVDNKPVLNQWYKY